MVLLFFEIVDFFSFLSKTFQPDPPYALPLFEVGEVGFPVSPLLLPPPGQVNEKTRFFRTRR